MSSDKPRRLGRGLEALIGTGPRLRSDEPPATAAPSSELRRIPIVSIRSNPFQPRHDFPEAELAELRASLATAGLLQPLVVRSVGREFELVSGERRLRAATQLGWNEIPAVVRDVDDRAMLTLALIENLQRADLNAIDAALGYQRLQEEFNLTHQQISDAVGKERSTVTNALRMLTLPESVQKLLREAKLTMGHARALLGLKDPATIAAVAERIVERGLSVRDVEKQTQVARPRGAVPAPRPDRSSAAKPVAPSQAEYRQMEETLRRHFQTDARIRNVTSERGVIEFTFYSTDDLNRLLELLTTEPQIGD